MPSGSQASSSIRRSTKCRKLTVSFVMLFFVASFLLLLVWSVASNLLSPTEGGGVQSSQVSLDQILERLQEKIERLENKAKMIQEIHEDSEFYNRHQSPTVEHGLIELRVADWNASLQNGLEDAISRFEAGESLGPHFRSTWSLYLTSTRLSTGDVLNVHLALDKWAKQHVWAGFKVRLYRGDGQLFLSRSHPVTDVLTNLEESDSGETWAEISIPNLMPLSSVPQLLNRNGSLRLTAELGLIGHGHRVYRPKIGSAPQSDTQTVVFTVASNSISTSNDSTNKGSNTTTTFSNFQLSHPWGGVSSWGAKVQKSSGEDISFSLILSQIQDDAVEWDELFAAFTVSVSGASSGVGSAPLHNFMAEPEATLVNFATSPNKNTTNAKDDLLEFRVGVTVFNRNARFGVNFR
ncbi:hypothetical protein Fcan01_13358 [Folsomia candida]|uniref:Uncharacterized protein n=1 Tax=Folsomia candida TaxID=158441 RepID=A0A226E2Z8_FOLCA|nr:hypothetical protein Fcan01_13358 [Folsomia candida]